MGQLVLSKVQYGLESAHGTGVAADTMLLCTVALPETDRVTHIPNANHGSRIPLLAASATMRRVLVEGLTLEDSDGAYFQLFPLLLSAALNGNVTPAEQNVGEGDYLWSFVAPRTGAEDVDSFTLEMGDDTQGYEVQYSLIRSLTISGDCASGEVHVSADVFGERIEQTTLTGALTAPTVELCNGKISQMWIDGTWANIGTTEVTNSLVNWELNLSGGVHPKLLGSSGRLFSTHGQGEIASTLTLTLERSSTLATEELLYRPASTYSPTMRALRLKITGDTIGSGDPSSLVVDMTGIWTSWQPLGGEVDGNTHDVVVMTLADDITGAVSLQMDCTTTLATI